MATPAITALPNLSEVCQGPLSWRVPAATRLLNECAAKEAPAVFRSIIQSVFGVGPGAGGVEPSVVGSWGLQYITRGQHPQDYSLLYGFLCSSGPLMSMALRHATDSCMVFEFPVSCLPACSRVAIAEGDVTSHIYAGKLYPSAPGKQSTSVLLNAFEYYMFQFSYFLIHVGERDVGGQMCFTSIGDALYPTLLEDYLHTFLPCDGSAPPSLGQPHPQQQFLGTPGSPVPSEYPLANRLATSSLYHLSSLVSPSSPQHNHVSSHQTASHFMARDVPSAHQQLSVTFTSQVVAQVLVEMWVNQCQPVPAAKMAPLQATQPRLLSSPRAMQQQQSSYGVGASVMSEHIRAVRMIIKHFHYFSNSIRPAQPSPLDKLRSSLWGVCRKSFYLMFVELLSRWPLDASFRLLLEAWLSYIQPWRYTSISSAPGVEVHAPIDWQWQKFVADNLLFYAHILSSILPRLLRLDLSAARNVHMFFRISKVFSQQNLATLLQNTEDAMQGSTHGLGSPQSPNRSSSSSGRLSPHSAALAARTHIMEMEGPNFHYTPIFGCHTQEMVRQVLCNAKTAEMSIIKELETSNGNRGGTRSKGLMASVWEALQWTTECSVQPGDEGSIEELRRTLQHLETGRDMLQTLFQVSDNLVNANIDNEDSPSKTRTIVPDQEMTAYNGPVLTDTGRRQLVSGLRRKDIKYEGDPDLKPIGMGEFAVLVRLLFIFATYLNTKYNTLISQSYYRKDLVGIVWRCVLQPPVTIYEYQKGAAAANVSSANLNNSVNCHASYPVRVARDLPPRLSFRRVASRQLVLGVFGLQLLLSVLFRVALFTQFCYIALPFVILYFSVQLLLGNNILSPPEPPQPVRQRLFADGSP